MATLILDFDSCLVPVESLDLYASRRISKDLARLEEMEQLTRAGMEGKIPFEESLRRRLDLLAPERQGLIQLGRELASMTSHGAGSMVTDLQEEGHEVWIVSGGFQQVLLPVADALGIPASRVQGVRAVFDDKGRYQALDANYAFHRSKMEGLARLRVDWPRPAVCAGDGMTDLALLDAGLVDAFIAYTEHVQRREVLDRSEFRADTMDEVEKLTRRLWQEARG